MRELKVSVRLPKEVPAGDAGIKQAQHAAREAAVIALWEAEHLSTREAASLLRVTYYDYIELLGTKGISVVRHAADEATLAAIEQKLRLQPHP